MPEIIVVGVDGTETAARAAEQALRLAQGFGATLHVVTAYEGNKASLHGANYERAVIFGDRQEKAAETARTVAGSLSAGRRPGSKPSPWWAPPPRRSSPTPRSTTPA